MKVSSIKRPINTKEAGQVEFLIYRKNNSRLKMYTAVCLTFGIIEEGTDPIALKESINKAAMVHLQTVINLNLSEKLLNRYAPKKYWDIYFDLQKQNSKPITTSTTNAYNVQLSPYNKIQGFCFA